MISERRRNRAKAYGRQSVSRHCAYRRLEALEWLEKHKDEEWWHFECSYVFGDLCNHIAANIISIKEILTFVNADEVTKNFVVKNLIHNTMRYYTAPLRSRRKNAW